MSAAAAGYQRLLERRATDVTVDSASRRTLVVAPHPDDESLGCGATIARKRAAGTAVRVVIVADGRYASPSNEVSPAALAALRRDEALAALAELGVAQCDVRFLEIEDTNVAAQETRVTAALTEELARFEPEEILLPSALDGHDDHRAVNRAARAALKGLGRPVTVLEYPVWFWDARSWVDRPVRPLAMVAQLVGRPLLALRTLQPRSVRSGGHLDAKRRALAAHRSQFTNLTGERDWPVMDPSFVARFERPVELFFAGSAKVPAEGSAVPGRPTRPTVLHVLPDFQRGGGQLLLLRTLAALPEAEHLVTALSGGPMAAQFVDAGHSVVVLGSGSDRQRAARQMLGGCVRLARLARQRRVDVMHLNNTWRDRVVGQAAALLAGVPVVTTLHGMAPERSRWNVARNVNRAVARRHIRRFIAVSDDVAASYQQALGIAPGSVVVVPPGLAAEAFVAQPADEAARTQAELGLTGPSSVILCVARLVAGKGHALLLDAFGVLAESRPDAWLFLAGDGPLRSELAAIAERLGIGERVVFLGERDDVPRLLAAADVVVSASESEGFPLNVLEALAAARPVVALTLPTLRRALGDDAAVLVDRRDPLDLAAALTGVLEDPDAAAAMAARGREVAAQYPAAATARAWATVYDEVRHGGR